MTRPPRFDATFQDQLLNLFIWRRDVRHFLPTPLPEGMVEDLIRIACLSPSVGLSEPWRFVVVNDRNRRAKVKANFMQANAAALATYEGERAQKYAALKLEGLDVAPVQLAVFADPDPEQGARLGRLSMPETVNYSVVTAVHTLWLAAMAKGFGLGWISILDPQALKACLEVPAEWRLIGYFCLGFPKQISDSPELEREGWEKRRDLGGVLILR